MASVHLQMGYIFRKKGTNIYEYKNTYQTTLQHNTASIYRMISDCLMFMFL